VPLTSSTTLEKVAKELAIRYNKGIEREKKEKGEA
jgi:hypothetical protein